MTTFLGIEQHLAQGANLIFFIPTCIVAIIVNWMNKKINFKVAVPIIFFGIIGAVIGAKISVYLPIKHLRRLFGVFLLVVSLSEFSKLINMYIKIKKS